MSLRKISSVVAVAAVLLVANSAHAQPMPQPVPVDTSRRVALPPGALETSMGLDVMDSRSPLGLVAPTKDQVRDYVNSVSALHVAATFQADKGRDQALGPLELKGGAKIKVTAGYTKKNGQPTATLDGIVIEGNGVSLGPTSFTRAEVHANGQIDVKLSKWLPEFTIKKVEKQADGSVLLKGNWYTPNVEISKDGTVKVGKLGIYKTVAKIDPRMFASWPPTAEDILAIATAPKPPTTPGAPNPLEKVAGNLTWDVSGKSDGLPIELDGKAVNARPELELKGNGRLANGRFTTVGDNNTAKVTIDFGGQSLGDDKMGINLKKGVAVVEGKYRVDVPLKDPAKHAIVEFDGKAEYSVTGTDAHLTLPSGGKIRIAEVEASRAGNLSFRMNGDSKVFKADDGRYDATLRGPITLEKVGPIESLSLDGELKSTGTARIGGDGKVVIEGDLRGESEVDTNGYVALLRGDKGYFKANVKKGSKVRVDLDRVAAALTVPLPGTPAAVPGAKPQFLGADASGRIEAHAAVSDLDTKGAGTRVTAKDGTVDLSVDGSAKIRGTDATANAHVDAKVGLESGANVEAKVGPTTVKTTVDAGSHVDASADVTVGPATARPSSGATATVTANRLNARRGPGTNQPVLRVLPKGEKLKVLSTKDGWAQVESASGEKFYVSDDYIAMQAAPAATVAPAGPAVNVKGKITGELGSTGVDATGGPVNAHVSGNARATIDAPFDVTADANGVSVDRSKTSARVPVRIDLKKGTRVAFQGKKEFATEVTIDTDGSYVQMVGDIAIGPDGMPLVKELKDVDLQLSLGPSAAKLFGTSIDMPVKKVVTLKGRVVIRKGGLDIYGDFGVRITGDDHTPIFRINF